MTTAIPDTALSIMNPWAFLIAHGLKDIENRDQNFKFRGEFAIHAGKAFDEDALTDVLGDRHPVHGGPLGLGIRIQRSPLVTSLLAMADGAINGGIVGVAEIVDCVPSSDSEWFVGKYGLVIRNARPVEFIPTRGMQGFFPWRKFHKAA